MCSPLYHISLVLLITKYVQSGHVSFNISQIDYEFDELSNDYSYDSGTVESAEETTNLRRLCSKYSEMYVANRQDCNRFFVCGSGAGERTEPLLGICPSGLWFDPYHTDNNKVMCILPEVLCATDHTEAYRYCNCSNIVPSFAMQANELAADIEMDPLIETSIICIVDNELHLYASKRDCERYFVCYNQKVFRMQCKPGMHFNAVHGYCDTQYEAKCEMLDAECPPIGITFLRHPAKCDAFYYCVFGQKMLQACPFYHIWSDEERTCVRRDQGMCHLDV